LGERVLRRVLFATLRTSLVFSARPAALLLRRVFASAGSETAEKLNRYAPAGVVEFRNERYGVEPDMLLDVYRPGSLSEPLPLLYWVHGGAFCGGSKDELAGYFKLLASEGYVVVGPRYSLAPEHRYPVPPRQMMQALAFLLANAGRLQIDPDRIVLGGDSAGAHIAAQIGALVTSPAYAEEVGITPTVQPAQLRGLALACGPYDLKLARGASSPVGRRFIQVVLWAYSGTREFLEDPAFATWSIPDHLTSAFPPTLITVGNGDPLRPHSELLARTLQGLNVEVETVFFPDDLQPPLTHEYQFNLDSTEGQLFLSRLTSFLARKQETTT